MRIGILALQGAFAEHKKALDALGVQSFEIRQRKDIENNFNGLIIPGGESTVIGKLLYELDLFSPLKAKIDSGFPVFGTCAGLLLLAKEITNFNCTYFSSMDIKAKRNAYGRQLGSFHVVSGFKGIGKVPMTFIRAPYIESVAEETEVLAEVGGHIVAAKQGKQLVTSFHPELGDDVTVHRFFINMI